jgi:hypothetical protein
MVTSTRGVAQRTGSLLLWAVAFRLKLRQAVKNSLALGFEL